MFYHFTFHYLWEQWGVHTEFERQRSRGFHLSLNNLRWHIDWGVCPLPRQVIHGHRYHEFSRSFLLRWFYRGEPVRNHWLSPLFSLLLLLVLRAEAVDGGWCNSIGTYHMITMEITSHL